MKTVLVTGGAGYVGSHCCNAFSQAGWRVVVFDNLSRGHADAVRYGPLVVGDILDRSAVRSALAVYRPDLVAHFAALAYVGESVGDPGPYYATNVLGAQVVLDSMRELSLRQLILSSSCATYGMPIYAPIDEAHPQKPINPYGWSKLVAEQLVLDYAAAYDLKAMVLRYFNAAGCDPQGALGERHDPETHIILLAIRAALGQSSALTVHGRDFPTRDGTCERDFVHVCDLARAHVLAAERLAAGHPTDVINLGGGRGATILELLRVVAQHAGREVPVVYGPRRIGDPHAVVAAISKARDVLGWRPLLSGLDEIVRTAIAWERAHVARTETLSC